MPLPKSVYFRTEMRPDCINLSRKRCINGDPTHFFKKLLYLRKVSSQHKTLTTYTRPVQLLFKRVHRWLSDDCIALTWLQQVSKYLMGLQDRYDFPRTAKAFMVGGASLPANSDWFAPWKHDLLSCFALYKHQSRYWILLQRFSEVISSLIDQTFKK